MTARQGNIALAGPDRAGEKGRHAGPVLATRDIVASAPALAVPDRLKDEVFAGASTMSPHRFGSPTPSARMGLI